MQLMVLYDSVCIRTRSHSSVRLLKQVTDEPGIARPNLLGGILDGNPYPGKNVLPSLEAIGRCKPAEDKRQLVHAVVGEVDEPLEPRAKPGV